MNYFHTEAFIENSQHRACMLPVQLSPIQTHVQQGGLYRCSLGLHND